MKLTSIITVNYNQPKVTIAFLESVKVNTSVENVEVILIDNGCKENFEMDFKAVYPELVYIRSDNNLGFAGGNNLGIDVATGEYLLLLNNDTEITSDLIEQLTFELVRDPEIGMISPLILYYDQPKIIQYAGFTKMNYLTARNSGIGSMEVNKGQYDQVSEETGFCHGAAMMCRRKDVEEIGRMEDSFFLYYEELDWCEKFKRAGKKIWFTGRTEIFHKESMSVGKESNIKTYFMTRNRMLYIRRNTGFINAFLFSLYFVFIACTKQIFIYLRKGRGDLVKWVWSGIWWNMTHSKYSANIGFKFKQ